MEFPKTAIVLAGGMGTRLKSVVSDVPKPLAPINGRPFLEYLLDQLAAQGITEVIFAVGYKGKLVEEAFGEEHDCLSLHYSYEPEALGTGGAVQLALGQHNADEPVWVINGDTFFACDLATLAKAHHDARPDVTLALHHVDPADRYGVVELSNEGLIDRFREKKAGTAGFINAGVYLLEPAALLRFDLGENFSLERDFFAAHLEDLRMLGVVSTGFFIDIGIPEDYARAQEVFGKD